MARSLFAEPSRHYLRATPRLRSGYPRARLGSCASSARADRGSGPGGASSEQGACGEPGSCRPLRSGTRFFGGRRLSSPPWVTEHPGVDDRTAEDPPNCVRTPVQTGPLGWTWRKEGPVTGRPPGDRDHQRRPQVMCCMGAVGSRRSPPTHIAWASGPIPSRSPDGTPGRTCAGPPFAPCSFEAPPGPQARSAPALGFLVRGACQGAPRVRAE